jgi:thioredoxin-like negative regulator of GroEL
MLRYAVLRGVLGIPVVVASGVCIAERRHPPRLAPMMRLALWLAGTLACGAAVSAADASPVGIAWAKDWKAAQKQARAAGRPVLVDFWAEWCHWCHELDRTTYADPGVVALAAGFVAVKVNAEGSLGELELTRRYEVRTLPTIAFLSPHGRLLLRRTAFEDAAKFAATLRRAARVADAAAPFEEALAKNEKDAAALAGLGGLLFDQGLTGDAETLLAKARRLDRARPLDERRRTRGLLAEIARHLGRPGEARKLAQEAEALRGGGPAPGR